MGHIDVTKRLLDNGADMEAEDNALYTPLWRAAYYGHPEVVEVRACVRCYIVYSFPAVDVDASFGFGG